MRLWFRRLSIQTKLVGIVMLASSVALLLACTAFLVYELSTFRESAANDLNAMAQMIGGTSTAAIAFGDHNAATETLNTLRGEAHIVEACIYRRDGLPLARYSRNASVSAVPSSPLPDGPRFDRSYLTLFRGVVLDGERVGTVYLKSDLDKMYARVVRYAYIAVAVLLASLLAAGLVSTILQRLISRPILDLADTASRVSRDGNYTIRAMKGAEDEIGILVDRFNGMLSQVHSRDEALKAAKDELEDRVAERTRQLQAEIGERKIIEKDLITAKETAEASSNAKSVFLANMSHELRTPLNAIIGYSEMLEEDAEDSGRTEIVADLRKIHGAGKHLLSLINDVLDLSKVEAGRMEVKPESFAIGQLVDEAASTAEPLARRNGNRLVINCGQPGAIMEADLLKFRQSLFNLLSNACKFTENGQVTLTVKRTTSEGEEWFDWEVTDTGIGIPADQMHKLFQSFSQVDSSSTRKHGGTGLGLAISQRLCEMMGGRILVESVPGAGSKFTIRLPANTPEHSSDQGHELAGPGTQSRPKTILIIEASAAVRERLESALAKDRFELTCAASGQDGIRKAAECIPSAILLNLHQPDVDGWALFRQLKLNPLYAKVPILVHALAEDCHCEIVPGLKPEASATDRLVVLYQVTGSTAAPDNLGCTLLDLLEGAGMRVFHPDLGFSAHAQIAHVGSERIELDLQITSEGSRELFEQLARSHESRRVSVVRLGPRTASSGDLSRIAQALVASEAGGRDTAAQPEPICAGGR